MKKQFLVITTSLFLLCNLNAQETTQTFTENKIGFDISLSYYGEMMLRPGIKAGIGHPILGKTYHRTKIKKRSKATVLKATTHELIGQANIGFYHHARNHSNSFVNVEVGYRIKLERQKNEKSIRGMQFEILAGIGPSYYFLSGDTYVFDEENTTIKKHRGNLAWMKTLAFSIGGRIPNKKNIPIYWHFKPSIFWETPFNLGTLIHPVLEMGVRYEL